MKNLMPFEELCVEVMEHIRAYDESREFLEKRETQSYRDHLSYMGSVLAFYAAEFYYESIKAEFRRKIGESKEVLRIKDAGEAKTQGEAETKAKVNAEALYDAEATAGHLHMKAKLLREQVNHTLNSMSSRLGSYEKE